MEEWADGNKYLDLPVLKYPPGHNQVRVKPGHKAQVNACMGIHSPLPQSFICHFVLLRVWLYLLLLGWLLLNRRFSRCLPLGIIFGYFLTLLSLVKSSW